MVNGLLSQHSPPFIHLLGMTLSAIFLSYEEVILMEKYVNTWRPFMNYLLLIIYDYWLVQRDMILQMKTFFL